MGAYSRKYGNYKLVYRQSANAVLVIRFLFDARPRHMSLTKKGTGSRQTTSEWRSRSKWPCSPAAGVRPCESRTLFAWETQTNNDWFIAISKRILERIIAILCMLSESSNVRKMDKFVSGELEKTRFWGRYETSETSKRA